MKKTTKMKNPILSLIVISLFLSFIPIQSFASSWNDWIFQNPYPTSNVLLGVKFITPQKGWMVGQYGTILYTEDGGETWEAQESGTEQDLKSVSFVNEKQGWVVGNSGVIAHTDDGGKSWKRQGDATVDLHKIFFINDKDGWAGGNSGVLLHTQDGGKNWIRIPLGTGVSITGIFFKNSFKGWVLSGGTVYRTIDGGKAWEASEKFPVKKQRVGRVGGGIMLSGMEDALPADWWVGSLFFIDDKKGWAVTGHWYIFHTDDGGATWQAQYSEYMSYGFGNIFFTNTKQGCVIGTSILCTEDGGNTWKERLGIEPGGRERIKNFLISLSELTFSDQSTGWAVGESGLIFKTEDGGQTWKIKTRHIHLPYFINKKTGWGLRDSNIIITSDGGNTWGKYPKEEKIGLTRFFFLNENIGWAVGEKGYWNSSYDANKIWGIIQHTRDGGKTWITQFKESIGNEQWFTDLRDVFFVNPNIGWAVGVNGTLLHTKDGGKHWERQKSGTKLHIKRVQFIDAKRGLAIADHGWAVGEDDETDAKAQGIILYTDDGGQHWRTVWKNSTVLLNQLFRIDNDIAWVTGDISSGALLLYSKNGGKNWSEKKIEGISLESACFEDKDRGVLFIDKERMLITKDSGKTWNKQKKLLLKRPWHCSEIFNNTEAVK